MSTTFMKSGNAPMQLYTREIIAVTHFYAAMLFSKHRIVERRIKEYNNRHGSSNDLKRDGKY